jgi:hypothetical protein
MVLASLQDTEGDDTDDIDGTKAFVFKGRFVGAIACKEMQNESRSYTTPRVCNISLEQTCVARMQLCAFVSVPLP